jgi:hypothetical protein
MPVNLTVSASFSQDVLPDLRYRDRRSGRGRKHSLSRYAVRKKAQGAMQQRFETILIFSNLRFEIVLNRTHEHSQRMLPMRM